MIPISFWRRFVSRVVTQKVAENCSSTLLGREVLLDNRPFDSTEGAKSFRSRSPFGSLTSRVCEPSSSSQAINFQVI